MDNNPSCPVCPGVGRYLGALGSLEHFRCESCGWTFHLEPDEGERADLVDIFSAGDYAPDH